MRAQATANRLVTEGTKFRFDDLVVAILELESGGTMKVAANFGCVHPHYHDVQVFGTKATFVNGLDAATLWTDPGDGGPRRARGGAPIPGIRKGAPDPLVRGRRGRRRARRSVTADEVFHVMATCFAIDRAAETGAAVEVEAFG